MCSLVMSLGLKNKTILSHISPYDSIYKNIATSGEKIVHFFCTSPSKTEWILSAAKFETAALSSTPFSIKKEKKEYKILEMYTHQDNSPCRV